MACRVVVAFAIQKMVPVMSFFIEHVVPGLENLLDVRLRQGVCETLTSILTSPSKPSTTMTVCCYVIVILLFFFLLVDDEQHQDCFTKQTCWFMKDHICSVHCFFIPNVCCLGLIIYLVLTSTTLCLAFFWLCDCCIFYESVFTIFLCALLHPLLRLRNYSYIWLSIGHSSNAYCTICWKISHFLLAESQLSLF